MAVANRSMKALADQRISLGSSSVNYPNRFIFSLFLLFCVNTVIPVVDIPLLGLSITSVFFALVALEVTIKLKFLSFNDQARWILLAYAFGLGVFVSIFANGIFGTLDVQLSSIVKLVQVTYWLGVFLVTIALFSHLRLLHIYNVIWVLGVAVLALGGLRLYEAIIFNRIGPSTSEIFTQNGYGILFSTFTPFALILPFMAPKIRDRIILIFAVLSLLLAIGLNGSRSSWVATSAGIVTFGLLLTTTGRRSAFGLIALSATAVLFGMLLISILPSEVLEPVSARFLTLENYEEDKSYATRTLMQQKSILLFESSPLYGIGRGEFRNVRVALDFANTPFSSSPATDFNRIASHNTYAQLLGETGLVGVGPLIVLLVMLLTLGARSAVGLSNSGNVWAVAIFASFIAMSIHMWSIDNLNTTGSWFVYGLSAGMIEYYRRQLGVERP